MIFNYYLKDKKADTTLLYLFISYKGNRIKLSLGIKIPSMYWDSKRNEVKSNFVDYKQLNDNIFQKSKPIRETFLKLSLENPELELTELKEMYLNRIEVDSKKLYDNFNSLIKLVDLYIDYLTLSKSKNSLKAIITLKNQLTELNKFYPLTLSKIDKNFPDAFLDYFSRKKLSNNYFMNQTKHLKTIMNWGFEREFHNFVEFQRINFKNFIVRKDEIETFSLSIDEFKRIINLELKESRLTKARDIFVFACLTGQRYKDYKNNLRKEDIDGNFWRMKQEKTNTITNIPLNDVAKEILIKYDYNLPVISNQKLNDYIKIIGERAEINKPFTKIRKSGNKTIKETKPKYEFLSFHDSRRTFISISDELGINPEIIRQISGHKTYSEFKKYLNIEEDRIKNESEKWNKISKIGAL